MVRTPPDLATSANLINKLFIFLAERLIKVSDRTRHYTASSRTLKMPPPSVPRDWSFIRGMMRVCCEDGGGDGERERGREERSEGLEKKAGMTGSHHWTLRLSVSAVHWALGTQSQLTRRGRDLLTRG